MSWCVDLNGEKFDCFIIKFFSLKFSINQCCLATGFIKLMLRLDFLFIMVPMKCNCEEYAKALMDELKGRFLNYELMSTLNCDLFKLLGLRL